MLRRLWGRGAGPGPSQTSPSNKGLIQGCGAERGCSETRYGGGSSVPAQRGRGGCGRRGLAWLGGPGCRSGTLLCAARLRRAPLAARCGCDVSMQGRSRRTDTQTLPPAQALSSTLGGEPRAWRENPGAFLTLTQNLSHFQACSKAKCLCEAKGGHKPHFLISHFLQQTPGSKHCSLPMPQTPAQPPTAHGTGKRRSDVPSRAPAQGRAELGCSCWGQQWEHSPCCPPERPLPSPQGPQPQRLKGQLVAPSHLPLSLSACPQHLPHLPSGFSTSEQTQLGPLCQNIQQRVQGTEPGRGAGFAPWSLTSCAGSMPQLPTWKAATAVPSPPQTSYKDTAGCSPALSSRLPRPPRRRATVPPPLWLCTWQ